MQTKLMFQKYSAGFGQEDCFEDVIRFETLNPPPKQNGLDDKDATTPIDNLPCGLNDHGVFSETDSNTDSESDSGSDTINCVGEIKLMTPRGRILCKPSLESLEAAIRIANMDPKRTIFFDGSARNIAAGKAAGLHTVLVGRSELVPGADVALESIHNIREALPEIWQQDGDQLEPVVAATAVEAIVLA